MIPEFAFITSLFIGKKMGGKKWGVRSSTFYRPFFCRFILTVLSLAPLVAVPAAEQAQFIVPPEVIIHHTPERSFIGPGMLVLENGDILMAAPWGRPPTNFEQIAAKFPVPMLYRSTDGGRTWKEQGRMKMEWNLTGLISDGGTSFLRLPDARIAVVFNRHVKGLHGGGTPVIAFSADNGQTWTAAKVLIEKDDAFYVMNDRLIQLRSGRLMLPVARKVGKTEGDRDESLAMLSDDAGATWRLSRGAARIEAPRGMAEPCVAELSDGRVLMMGRTGLGTHHVAFSSDGGETWSKPEATTLVSACSSLTLKTLPDGRLIVFYNHAAPLKAGAFFPRTPLCYAVSDDSGKTWSPPVIVDDEGVASKDRQNIYPSICFTKEGMLVMWSTHGADPKGSFAGQYDPSIGGGKRAILAMPAKAAPKATAKPVQSAESAMPADIDGKSYDLVVVGATPGGIACAVRAAREGLSVLLVNHTMHLGGFMTSGAGGWEAPYDGLRSPLYGEMITGAAQYYAKTYGEGSPQHIVSMPSKTSRAHIDRPKVEPRIAEMLFNQMVGRERSLTVLLGHIVTKAERDGASLKSVTLKPVHGEGVITVSGKVFADAMYEGDLMAAAGVKTQIGRESRAQYGEKHAGVIYTKERHKEPGQRGFPQAADQGTLNIRYNSHATGEIVEGPHSGEADSSVMAYNYRLILTRDPANRVMVEKPANYDPAIAKAAASGGFVPNLPNSKVAWNGGRLIGPQNGYPAADWPAREAISRRYLDAMLMRLWWIQNDPDAPSRERESFAGYGLAKDEFPDNGHLPYEIYVREARRLVGRYVFKEQDNLIAEGIARTPVHSDSIAMTDWPVDSVACLPRTTPGGSIDGIFFLGEESRPAQVPYRSLLPNEVENLLVPVAISASHVGWGAIRLEPTWMQLGESAGHAAALAVKTNTTPAKLDPDALIRKLASSRVMISFFNDVDVTSDDPRVPAAQYFGTKGFFASYDAKLDELLTEALKAAWEQGFEDLQAGTLDPMRLARTVHAAEAKRSPTTDKKRGDFLLAKFSRLSKTR